MFKIFFATSCPFFHLFWFFPIFLKIVSALYEIFPDRTQQSSENDKNYIPHCTKSKNSPQQRFYFSDCRQRSLKISHHITQLNLMKVICRKRSLILPHKLQPFIFSNSAIPVINASALRSRRIVVSFHISPH